MNGYMKRTKKLVWWGSHQPNLEQSEHQKEPIVTKNIKKIKEVITARVKIAVNSGGGRKHTVDFWNAGNNLFLDLKNNYVNIL